MKASNYIVDQIYPLLSSVQVAKFKDCKPTNTNVNEYVVINSLPLPYGVMQTTIANVNCHVKDKGEGIPDRSKLDALTTSVLTILEKVTTTNMLLDYESSELIREEKLGEHYFNLRFKVSIINK